MGAPRSFLGLRGPMAGLVYGGPSFNQRGQGAFKGFLGEGEGGRGSLARGSKSRIGSFFSRVASSTYLATIFESAPVWLVGLRA